MSDQDIIAEIATQHGLARVPLFSVPLNSEARHEILLDGNNGSFAISVDRDEGAWDPSSWIWSSNIPHHVSIVGNDVTVLRWDLPDARLRLKRDDILKFPREFYSELRHDQVDAPRNIVTHCMTLFRRLRVLVQHSSLDDAKTIDVYLAVLTRILRSAGPDGYRSWNLSAEAEELLEALSNSALETAISDFRSVRFDDHTVTAYPSLAIRHASGAIFQEAHNLLRQAAGPDLFDYVQPAVAVRPKQSSVHFTPPAIARSIAEQALRCFPGLRDRTQLVLADFACGSGAFLIEALRALGREGFAGNIKVVGRDISPIAIRMARFAVGAALGEWPNGSKTIDIECANSLDGEVLPFADIVVMNPPFAAWQDLTHVERGFVSAALPKAKGRPDLSMAFIERALNSLSRGGVIATLLPASLLETKSSAAWRDDLANRGSIVFRGTFDNHGLFSAATVRLGALVLSTDRLGSDRFELRAGAQADAVGDALRALRRLSQGFDTQALQGEGWSIRRTDATAPMGKSASASEFTAPLVQVNALFRVMQGIRTGCNPAFVLDESSLSELPRVERKYFQRALTSRGIRNGRIVEYAHVFYPYSEDESAFTSERELRQQLPTYYSRYLAPHKEALRSRASIGARWWELTRRRPKLRDGSLAYVSKYFASPGGFGLELTPNSLVLQGYGWVPIGALGDQIAREFETGHLRVSAAYLALLNSDAFFEMLSEYSPPVQGGQLDMSPRFLNAVPIPDLLDGPNKGAVSRLASFARSRYLGKSRSKVSADEADILVRQLLGRATPKASTRPSSEIPEWAIEFLSEQRRPPSRELRVGLIFKMQSLARSGETEQIDVVLHHADVSALSEASLITLLRGTFAFNGRLRQWIAFRDRVSEELHRRGIDRRKVLVGLEQ